MIKGLLVGYFDKPEGVYTTFARLKTTQILEEHLEVFQSNSLENLILDFTSHLRDMNGHEASLQALMTGVEILPESNDIKYDGVLDLYVCIEDGIIEDRSAGIQRLEQLLDNIDSSALNSDQMSNYEILRVDVDKMC